MIDEEQIRLFNELMSTQPGEQIEGLASRYPDVFEKPRVNEIPDPLNMKGRIADSERKRKEQEEAEFQAKYGQKTILDMARPEFIPDDITAAIKAIGTLGSGAGAGIKGMIGEAFGMDPEATVQRNIYFPDVLEKAKSGQKLTPDEERELAFYGRYIDKGSQALETAGDLLEPLGQAYDASKLDALMFMPGTRNISMIDDVIEMGIRGARDVAPVVKPAIQSAGQAARLAIRDDLLPLTQKATQATKEYFETPPVGAISLDTLGFSSRLSEGVDKLQDKGTGTQFLAQLSKMKGVPLAEIKVTGLDEYLKNTPRVTKQEVQDYLETNRLQLIEDERIAGAGRIDSEVVQYLPQQFDWLGKEDLAEEFEDKAHLRNHLIRTLDRHFDDLEAEADNTGSFYARDSSTGDLRYIPASKRFEWREAEIDKIDNELGDLPEFNGATNFEGDYQIPGGQNYREILYKLPDDKVEGVFRPPDGHFPNAENTFGSIRATDREIDGTPTLFAEEIQSDWAIAAAKGGYGPQPMPDVDAETLRTTPDIQYRLSPDQKVFLEDLAIENDIAYFSPKSEERTKEIQRLQKKYDDWKATEKIKGSVPDNPFRGNWYKPVINNFLVKAAQEGKGGIGFPVGEIVKDRYNLANVVDRIESSTDKTIYPTPLRGGPFKNVTIDLKPALAGANEKQMRLRVDKDGLVRGVNAEQYNRFIGKPLTEVVGKGVSEKILSNDSQVMTDLDLKIGGEGKDKLYDDMLPKHLNEIGKRYGVQLEKRTIPFGEGKKKESEVYFMPITEEMRNDILSEGLPMFKQGGSVKKFAPGGKVLKEVAKGAKKAAKQATKETKSVIDDWEWRPSQQVIEEVGLTEVPEYIQSGFGNFMAGQQKRAKAGEVGIRDLIKAYTITRSSVNRSGLPRETATKTGMKIPKTEGLVRPEGAFSEWLGSKQGQNYLKAAERGEIDERAIADLQEKFAPFGMASVLANDMRWAVNNAPSLSDNLSEVIVGDPQIYRNVSQQLQGIGPAKSGFMGSLIGRGDFPTLDARQLRLHTGAGGSEAAKYMRRQQGLGGEQAVGRLADRQQGMNLDIDPALDPFYQHLTHHAVWDKVANEQTTHDDIVRAMTGYAKGGPIKSALEGVGKAAAEVKKAGKLSKLKEDIRQDMGNYGAMRVERAADEIPNLEKLYSERALQEAFKGDNAKVLMTINPKDFERFAIPLTPIKQSFPGTGPKKESLSTDEYVRYLSGVEGFHSVPFLSIDKEEFGLPLLPFISGHEGRHRNRALAMRGEESGLVQLLPRAELREPFPRRYQDEYIEALKAELGLTGNKVLPEKFNIPSNSVFDKQLQRPEIMLPDIYAKGGAVKSIVSGAQRAAKEGQKMLQGVYRGYTGERLEEPVLSTTPQRKVAEYYATRRAATRGEDPHIEMLMVDPFVGKEYGLALPIDEFNRELLTTRARAIAPSDVVERTQLKKKGGLACLSK
jgi:hypothetical protein